MGAGDRYVELSIGFGGMGGHGLSKPWRSDGSRSEFSSSGLGGPGVGDAAALVFDRWREGCDLAGCFVADLRPAIVEHGPGVSFAAPMVSAKLEGDAIDPFDRALVSPGGSVVADAVASDPGNGYGSIVRMARAGVCCLDSCSPAAWALYWKRHGAAVWRVELDADDPAGVPPLLVPLSAAAGEWRILAAPSLRYVTRPCRHCGVMVGGDYRAGVGSFWAGAREDGPGRCFSGPGGQHDPIADWGW